MELKATNYIQDAPIATIVLSRPQRRNAWTGRMHTEYRWCLAQAEADAAMRVIVVTGDPDGRAFCAGADLTEFGTAPSIVVARRVRWERDVWGLFLGIRKPLIAALHGYVIGSGVEIACLCDIRIASDVAVPERRRQ